MEIPQYFLNDGDQSEAWGEMSACLLLIINGHVENNVNIALSQTHTYVNTIYINGNIYKG